MKRLLCLSIGIFILQTAYAQQFSQNDKDAISMRLEKFKAATLEENYEDLLKYIYPGVFEQVPKPEFLKLFTQLEAQGIKTDVLEMNIKGIEFLYLQDNQLFGIIPYSDKSITYLTNEESRNDPFRGIFIRLLEEQYGKDGVSYDQQSHAVSIAASRYLITSWEEETSEWYFLEFDTENMPFMNLVLPENVIKAALSRID